jgi:gliding motility-associated-like protein
VDAPNALASINTWTGVTVTPNDATGRVTGLNLSGQRLRGRIPAEIGALTELTTLNLANNEFTGAVPERLATLTRITTINLNRNFLTSLPSFRTTTSLTSLNAANNQLAFDSFEPNSSVAGATLAPQDSLGRDTTLTLDERAVLRFVPRVGGTANVYQWFKNGAPFGPSSSTSDLFIDDIRRLQDQGGYRLRITNSNVPGVTLWLNTVVVRVNPCFVSGSRIEPRESVFCEGQAIPNLRGPAVTSPIRLPITYQWQRTTDGGRTWVNVGGNTAEYQPPSLGVRAQFRRLASDGRCTTDTSNTVSVTFIGRIQNNQIRSSYILCPGDSVRTFRGVSPVTGGAGRLRYTWQSSINQGRTWRNEDATVNFRPQRITNDTVLFRRLVADSICFVDTSNVVRVVRSPRFPSNIVGFNQEVCRGGRALALRDTIRLDSILRTRDTVNFRFRWQVSANRRTWLRADTANRADTFSTFLPLYRIDTTLYFRRLVVGPCNTDTSNVVAISVVRPINGNVIRSDRDVVCAGDTTRVNVRGTFSINGGGGQYSFLWQSSLNRRDWNNRGTADSIAFRVEDISDTTFIRRIVRSRCVADTSNVIRLGRAFNYGPNTISGSTINCNNDTVSARALILRGTSSTSPLGSFRYQWQLSPDTVNWANIDTAGFSRDTAQANRRDPGTSMEYRPGFLTRRITYFRRIVFNGCQGDTSNRVFVSIVPDLTNNRITGTQTLCEGSPINPIRGEIPQGGGGGYRYRWEVSTQADTLGRPLGWALADTSVNYSPPNLIRTTYVRRVVVANQCRPDTSNIIKITIINRVDNNRIRDNQEVCLGVRPDTLRGSVPVGGDGNFQFVWQRQVGGTGQAWQTVASTRDFFPDINQTSRFRRLVFTECFVDTSNVVTVFITRFIRGNQILGGGQTICRGSRPDTLRGQMPDDGTNVFRYQWQTSRNRRQWTNINRAVAENLVLDVGPDSTTYYRRIVSNRCFSDTSLSVPIRVLDLPDVDAGPDTIVNVGQSIRLNATGASRYVWFPRDGLDNDSIPNPIAAPLETTTYIVRGTDPAGCTSVDTMVVRVATDLANVLRVVDIITPDGDGRNDVLHVDGLESFPENTVIIFNRWGQEILQRRNYRNNWDGTIDGKVIPNGVYFYLIRAGTGNRPLRGSFTVLN